MASSTHRIRIHANPSAVFKAVSTEDGMKAWYTPQIDGSLEEGKTATFRFNNGEAFTWKTTALIPDKQVDRECTEGPGVAKGTKVSYEIGSDKDGEAVLKLEHTNWPEGHEALSTCNTLWGILLGQLREYVEKGKSSPAVA